MPARIRLSSLVLIVLVLWTTVGLPLSQTVAAATTAEGSIALGAFVADSWWDMSRVDEFASLTGAPPAIIMVYQDWATRRMNTFDRSRMEAIVSRGATPLVTWEPWNYRKGRDQADYALRTIVSGQHDAYLHRWARDVAAWGKPLYLRFAHEMNGTWYPWAVGVNGNTAAEYVAAWRHVVTIFRAEQAHNVRWVWTPIAVDVGIRAFTDLYPGDDYVDWVGLDAYNWGTSQSWSIWRSFDQIIDASYQTLTAMTDRPLMIGEMAATERGGDKAAWITDAFLTTVPTRYPRIKAIVWFQANKETDWRVNSSTASLNAYRAVVAAPLYQGRLP